MIIETELKLTLSRAEIANFLHHSLFAQYQLESKAQQLYTVYFDSSSLSLLKQGYALRILKLGDLYIQTIKTTDKSTDGLHQRKEWHSEVTSMQPDLLQFSELAFINNFKESLIPIFTTDIHRTTWKFVDGETEIEIALDIGKISNTVAAVEVCEVELELLQGNQAKLFVLAEQLKKEVNLQAENISKAEKGYSLLNSAAV